MDDSYLEELKKRAKESKVYRKYQLVGLEVAQILQDNKHKSLYIKLAKDGDGEAMMRLAKDIAERSGVKNKGAYFMSMLTKLRNNTKVRRKVAWRPRRSTRKSKK